MFSSTALTSVMTAFRDITDVVINNDDQYDVYPGNFSKHIGKPKTKEDKYRKRRLQIWRNYETDKPKDEVLDNRLTQVPDAVNSIKSLLVGKKARKDVAFQRNKQHHLELAYKRVGEKLLEEKQTQDKLSKLENENARLKEELQNLKIKCHIDDLQHTRQMHHLRTKGKLISDN
tara:strand:- start:301 stop:822 length:522 start_codon:yes stop_codon:yes gene_type:complete